MVRNENETKNKGAKMITKMENQKIVDKWEIEGDDNEETLKRLKKQTQQLFENKIK